MCMEEFQIKPCHRRWSSIINPYVDRRDKLKWIIIKGWGKKENKVKNLQKGVNQITNGVVSASISSLKCFCSRSHQRRVLNRHCSNVWDLWIDQAWQFIVFASKLTRTYACLFCVVSSCKVGKGKEIRCTHTPTIKTWELSCKFMLKRKSAFKESLALAKEIWWVK